MISPLKIRAEGTDTDSLHTDSGVQKTGLHLKEAVVTQEQRRAVDAQVEDAVMAGPNVQPHGSRHELHALAPLHFQHPPHRPHYHLAPRP